MWFARLIFVLCVLPAFGHAADCSLKPPRPTFVQIDYKGGCQGGFAHGRGVALYQVPDQTKDEVIRHEGEFVHGVANGQTTYSSQSGNFGFQGEFRNWHPYEGIAFQPSAFGRRLEVTYRSGDIASKEYKSKEGGSPPQVAQQPTGPNPLAMLLERVLNKELQKRDARKQNEEQERQQRTQQVSPPVAMQDWGRAGGGAPIPSSAWANGPSGPKSMGQWGQVGGSSPVTPQEWGRKNEEERVKWQQQENLRRRNEAAQINAANAAQQQAVIEANNRERLDFERQAAEQRARYEREAATQRAADLERNRQDQANQQRIYAEQQAAESERLRLQEGEQQRLRAEQQKRQEAAPRVTYSTYGTSPPVGYTTYETSPPTVASSNYGNTTPVADTTRNSLTLEQRIQAPRAAVPASPAPPPVVSKAPDSPAPPPSSQPAVQTRESQPSAPNIGTQMGTRSPISQGATDRTLATANSTPAFVPGQFNSDSRTEQQKLDAVQMGLTGAGMTPVGAIADVANAGISLGRGNYADAAANATAAIPVFGDIGAAMRVSKKVLVPEKIHRHHSWPKYLGGERQQELVSIPKVLHEKYHSGLDKVLPRQKGGDFYDALAPSEKLKIQKDFENYTKGFDILHGTNLWEAALQNGFPR